MVDFRLVDFSKFNWNNYMGIFKINGTLLEMIERIDSNSVLEIKSIPRTYRVEFYSGAGAGERLSNQITQHPSPLILADKWIFENYLSTEHSLQRVPTFQVSAVEENKSIETVLEIIEFLEKNGASKTAMLFAVGGGIIQDLAAFSAYLFKRGIPWTFVPTTLLAQGDSSVGGKTALNHRKTKNLLGLFSAPRKIITDTGFLTTLNQEDWLSGAGEILRLCITGGETTLMQLEQGIGACVERDLDVTTQLIRVALSVKKSVVESDEFEIDIRRSMNYGHSFGHALEALTHFEISHGIGVTLGIMVENEISYLRGLLPQDQRDRILHIANQLLSDHVWSVFKNTNMDGILDLLKRDKKAEGHVLKLATLAHIGQIDFLDLQLDQSGEVEVRSAYASVLGVLGNLRNA
jgi:3-dehydroquinate synthase